MKKIVKISSIVLIAASFLLNGCASSKKGNWGCPNKQGIVGFK